MPSNDATSPVVSLDVTAVPPTSQATQNELAPTNTAVPLTATLPALGNDTQPATNTPAPITNDPINYAVVFVESNDVLNVRSGPGVTFDIVGTLPPTATEVRVTGTGQVVSGSLWVPVQQGPLTGWVNSRFLTESVADGLFCADVTVVQLLDRLKTAVANQDDLLLAQLIHPKRGLRVRLRLVEAETQLDNLALFSDPISYNWGVAAGSGEPLIGTPAQILSPLLQADLLAATETACNQLLIGGTASLTNLPTTYTSINYISVHRPGDDAFAGLNWGSWAIGIEQWEGQYYLSTLIHYQWEP